jgi:hypothetical protein
VFSDEVTPVTESVFSKTNKGLYKSQETVYFGTEPLLNPDHRQVAQRMIAHPWFASFGSAPGAVRVRTRSGDTKYVEATMTKGDHMAAKHIPRAPRPAGMPAAAGLLHGTGLPQ